MKLGTITFKNTIYNLDYMKKEELENLFIKNSEDKKKEYNKIKEITKRNVSNDKENTALEVSQTFKNFIDTSTMTVRIEAMIYRAMIDKTTTDTINEKVKNKRNAITASVKKVNSKFNNTNKKYKEVQEVIQESLKKYESILISIARFYDNKIEQLILRKVELEAHLVGKIIKEEYLVQEEIKREKQKTNDSLLTALSNSIKNVISKLTTKKEEKQIDITMISKLKDKEEIELEQKECLNNSLEQAKNGIKDNSNDISKLESDILVIEKEIKRLNENKTMEIQNAIESSNKQLVIKKENINIMKKIQRFILAKINTPKVIYDTIINPFNQKIDEYIENELKEIENN